MKRGASRQASRQAALQVLFAVDLAARERGTARPDEPSGDAERAFDAVAAHFELPPGAREFAAELVRAVIARREELDALLARHARNWRVSRMAAVDRNVLRIAAYELLCTDTPTRVVLDQAIELARRFGDAPSPGFVNGVLDGLARELRPGETPGRVEGAP